MISRFASLTLAVATMALGAPADARSPYAGRYRVAEGPDTAGMLELGADGRFRYQLSEGALDEGAEGAWSDDGGTIRLTTEPKPVPPSFSRARDGGDGAATLKVILADGRELGGIDFRLGLSDGGSLAGYTQTEGWSFAEPQPGRTIRWVELYEPIHGVVSPRFEVDPPAAGGLVFILTPNDIGTVDFQAAELERGADDFTLHRGMRRLRFVRER